MTKAEFVAKIANEKELTKSQAEKGVEGFISVVSDALVSGDKVSIVGLGTFSVVARPQRKGINPRTGEKIEIPASKVVKFKGWSPSENRKGAATTAIVPSDNQLPAVPEEVDNVLVNEAVQFINETVSRTIYNGALQIGDYLLENFFNDDIAAASSRNPRKPVSFRALCSREDLSLHPATLGEMVRVAAQERFFHQHNLDTDNLSYSHKAELVKIPNDDHKIQLVSEIVGHVPPYRVLAERIKQERSSAPATERQISPRHLLKDIQDSENRIEKSILPQLAADTEFIRRMRPEMKIRILEEARRLAEKAAEHQRACEDLIRALEGGE
ncbi:MAG: HU family DNA-binding protein [Syntrophobacteraceae bacterium]